MNTHFLNDCDYIQIIEKEIEEVLKVQFGNVRKKWDFLKFRIKEKCNKFSMQRGKARSLNCISMKEN